MIILILSLFYLKTLKNDYKKLVFMKNTKIQSKKNAKQVNDHKKLLIFIFNAFYKLFISP